MFLLIAGATSLAIWLYLLVGRGSFWNVSRLLVPKGNGTLSSKRVVAVIPARDEALTVGRAIRSLFAQTLGDQLHIVLVDDASSDGTADVAIQAAVLAGHEDRLTVVQAKPLAAGWTGKLWALSQGIAQANQSDPDYLLLTDADIVYGTDTLNDLVCLAEQGGFDLASLMVKLACHSAAEKMLIPPFVYFFLQLYPPQWIASAKYRTAGAAGGCILIRPAALARAGGLAAIRSAVIDDCALARIVKKSGGKLWLGMTSDVWSLRPYESWKDVARMIARTAFNQLHHSSLLLAATVVGLFLTYLVPVAAIATMNGSLMAIGATAWFLMAVTYVPMTRFYARSPLFSLTLPLAALFYMSVTVFSAWLYWRGRGGEWKGRTQDIRP